MGPRAVEFVPRDLARWPRRTQFSKLAAAQHQDGLPSFGRVTWAVMSTLSISSKGCRQIRPVGHVTALLGHPVCREIPPNTGLTKSSQSYAI